MRLPLEHVDCGAPELGLLFRRPCLPGPLQGVALDAGQNPRRLRPPHHCNAGIWPRPQKARIKGPARHAVIARPERPADQHGDLGHGRRGDRCHHLGAVPGDALVLVFAPDHEAGDVLQEHQRDLALRTQLHEMRGLLRAFGKQHAIVGHDPHIHAHHLRETRHDGLAEARLEFIEPTVINDARDDLADVIGRGQRRRHHIQKLIGVIGRVTAP